MKCGSNKQPVNTDPVQMQKKYSCIYFLKVGDIEKDDFVTISKSIFYCEKSVKQEVWF